MAYKEQYPLNTTPQGDSVKEAVLKNRDEIISLARKVEKKASSGGSGLRQRVLHGKVANGKYRYLSADGLSVTIDGIDVPVILTFADGFDENGAKDYMATIDEKISAWTLPANATSYLYAERSSSGALSYGSTTIKPVMQASAPADPKLDTFYFNTLEQKMYRYNGIEWQAVRRVFVAAVTTNATSVTKIAYMENTAAVEMTAAEKEKLSGIEAGAEVNQNTFSSVHVGDQYVIARGKKDSLELRPGTNIQLIPDGDNQCVIVNVTGTVGDASHAATAGHSESAGRADSAGYADRAGRADSAGRADTSEYADKAGCDRHGVIIDTGYSKFGYALNEAIQNGPLVDALQVDIQNQYSEFNKTHTVIDSVTKINMPDSIAWGVREVVFIDKNALIVRLTGLKTNATDIVVYYNVYNYGMWSGWKRAGDGEIPGGRIWFA